MGSRAIITRLMIPRHPWYRVVVIGSFADRATEDVFQGKDTRAARTLPKVLWPAIRRKLDMLNAAHDLRDLRVPPNNHLEALKGGFKGQHSIRVNDKYRISFIFANGTASRVRCHDYH